MKIPKGSIDNEHRVPDTPNVSGKVAQPEPKAKVAQKESAAQSQGRIWRVWTFRELRRIYFENLEIKYCFESLPSYYVLLSY